MLDSNDIPENRFLLFFYCLSKQLSSPVAIHKDTICGDHGPSISIIITVLNRRRFMTILNNLNSNSVTWQFVCEKLRGHGFYPIEQTLLNRQFRSSYANYQKRTHQRLCLSYRRMDGNVVKLKYSGGKRVYDFPNYDRVNKENYMLPPSKKRHSVGTTSLGGVIPNVCATTVYFYDRESRLSQRLPPRKRKKKRR